MAEIVARVGKVTGEVIVRDADGNVRRLKEGDAVRAGEVIQAASGGQVHLLLADGREVVVKSGEAARIDAEVAGSNLPDAGDSAVHNSPQTFTRVARTLVAADGTFSFDDDAGRARTSGDQSEGHSFVELARIVESVDPLAFQFATTRVPVNDIFDGGPAALYDAVNAVTAASLASRPASTLFESVTPVNDDYTDADETVAVAEDSGANTGSVLSGTTSADGPVSVVSFQVAGDATTYTAGQTATIAGVGTLVIAANGGYTFTPAANYSGAVPVVTYTTTDGLGPNDTSTLTLSVTPVNDAPVNTLPASYTTNEDTSLKLSGLSVADLDAGSGTMMVTLSVASGTLTAGTANGVTVTGSGTSSLVLSGTLANLNAYLATAGNQPTYVPVANASGTVVLTITTSDGANTGSGGTRSDIDTVNINDTPVADLPTLTVTNAGPMVVFGTSWETVANASNSSEAVGGATLEGWSRIDAPQVLAGGTDAFEVWASGDSQAPASGGSNTVYAAPGNGRNWLELNDASSNVQTIGISRSVATQAGMVYELSFDYAGRLGFTAGYTTISIQLDGVTIATYSSTSGNAALDWKNLKVSFVGDGNTHTLAILTTPTQTDPNGRGAAIDDITLAAYQGVTAGNASGGSLTQIALASYVSAGLTDTDGSETLSLTFGGLPAGAQIVTSSNTYNVSGGSITIQGSELASAKLQLASSYTGVLDVTVSATATETVGGATATTSTQTLEFHVQPASGVVTATDQTDASAVRLGTDAVDSLSGNNSANLMEGYAGNDTLDGGGGADLLVGGAGTDTITGGAGADTFKWSLADRGTVAAPATDTITDFDTTATSDKLDLRDLLVGELHSGTAAGNLADYLHFSYSAATGTTIDVKSVGSSLAGPDQKIILTGVDITSGNTLSDTAIIQNLLTNGKLIVD